MVKRLSDYRKVQNGIENSRKLLRKLYPSYFRYFPEGKRERERKRKIEREREREEV